MSSAALEETAAGPHDAAPGGARRTDQLWTAISAAAVLALLANLRSHWVLIAAHSSALGALGTLSYIGLFACVFAVLSARSVRAHALADVSVLVLAVFIRLLEVPALIAPGGRARLNDEGLLTNAAIHALAVGADPYGSSFAAVLGTRGTHLLNGTPVTHYDYPPLPLVLGLLGRNLGVGFGTISVINAFALIAAAILAFILLPTRLRPFAVLGTLALGFLDSRALGGEPVVIALPLLIVATARWYAVGDTGRLRKDVIAGSCLGLAMATQQLVWFLVPFLLVAMWTRHHGRESAGAAARRLLPYVATATVVFLVVNLPFAVRDASSWWTGMTTVLTQHAMPDGPGLSTLSTDVFGGSGAFGAYAIAALLVYVGLLVLVVLLPRRTATAFAILPMIAFIWSLRSEDTYYLCFAPLWVFLAAVTPPEVTTGSRGLLPDGTFGRIGKRVLAGVLFVPALLAFIVAVVTPAPLHFRSVNATVRVITVRVHNGSSHVVSPHFALLRRAQLTLLRTRSGPAAVKPGATASYRLSTPSSLHQALARGRVIALTDDPETASVGRIG